jgi:hypothetical protein
MWSSIGEHRGWIHPYDTQEAPVTPTSGNNHYRPNEIMQRALRDAERARRELDTIAGPLQEALKSHVTASIGPQIQAYLSAINANLVEQMLAPFAAWQATLARMHQAHIDDWALRFSTILDQHLVLPQVDLQSLLPKVDLQSLIPDLREITQSVFDSLAPSLDVLREVGRKYGTAHQTAEAFKAAGLWLAPSMPEFLIRSVVEKHRNGQSAATLASLISRYYAQSGWHPLREAVDTWRANPLFRPRMRVVDQALDAHIRGYYALTIPALLQLVEGISCDYLKTIHPQARLGGRTKHVVESALEEAPIHLFGIELGVAASSLLEFLVGELYLFKDFDQQYRALRSQKRLNRHAIHHGRQYGYDTRMNSLRMFLVLDMLSLLKPE